MTYQPKLYREHGGSKLVGVSGAEIELRSGAVLDLQAGVQVAVPVVEKTAAYTVVAGDSGTIFLAGAVDLKFTLPATVAGLHFTFVVKTVSATTGLQIDPAAADQIIDVDITVADDKDLINTAATDAKGDLVEIVGDGDAGWYVINKIGTWAREA